MRFDAPPVSHLRQQRMHRWAMLWLAGFGAFLQAAAEFAPLSRHAQRIGHRWLDNIERIVIALVIYRVTCRFRPLHRRRGVPQPRAKQTQLIRAILGGRMRRALRPKDLHARIAALRQNLDALVAQMLKRIPRGLTRRRAYWTAGAPAGIFPRALHQAEEGAGRPSPDSS
ncbi:MAG: hypothetical protein QM759_07295 [Terricaulis sp.]